MLHGRNAVILGVNVSGSRAGNPTSRIIVPHFWKYPSFARRCSEGSMDDCAGDVYPFCNAGMTKSVGVDSGPLPSPGFWGLGEGTKLQLVRLLRFGGLALLGVATLCIALPATLGDSAQAGGSLEERKLPMRFTWVACQPDCRGWVSAIGIVTSESPKEFDEFARGRELAGATVVLDSSAGSVNDSIALGRRFRNLGLVTTVGTSVQIRTAQGDRASVAPEAYCESMCVFLLLSGKTRYVPAGADVRVATTWLWGKTGCVPAGGHVRVDQIWMGDRADDAKAASYSAEDLMIVERDIGRLAKYTFDMGGAGDLLSLSLNVPPWEDLHELSRDELRLTNLVTTDLIAEVLPKAGGAVVPVAALPAKPVQDPLVSSTTNGEPIAAAVKSTKTAEAVVPT